MTVVTERVSLPAAQRPRRIAAPSWLDLRLVLGVALVLGSVFVGATVVASSRQTATVVAARRDLAAGTVLSAADLTLEQVRLPASGMAAYPDSTADVVGRQLSRPVSGGELVPKAALESIPTRTTITVPLEAAAAPDLRKGDRIEVWLSTGECAAAILLADVTVQAVRTDSRAFDSGSGGQDVIISVAPDLADRVVTALALEDAQLRAGILTGAEVPSGAELPDPLSCSTARR